MQKDPTKTFIGGLVLGSFLGFFIGVAGVSHWVLFMLTN